MKTRPTIYVAEDDSDDQYLMKMAFEEVNDNIELCMFSDGKALYAHLEAIDLSLTPNALPNLIILDINLPVWDGKKTLATIKCDQRFRHIPVIIYTTSKSEQDIKEVYELNANSYLVKPHDFDSILKTIKTLNDYWFETAKLNS